jgi:YbbR domain-containing protein
MSNSFFRRNLTNHILAALLALVLWSYVETADLAARTDVSKTFSDVALEMRNVAADLHIVSAVPDRVAVTVRGLPGEVDQLTRDSVLAYIDLANAGEGSGQYVVKVDAPQGVSSSAKPSRLEVKLERVIAVDLSLQTVGDQVVQDDQLVIASLRSQFVHVSGTRSQIERVARAVVQTDWSKADSGVRLSLPVQLLDSSGQEVSGLTIEPGAVEAVVSRYPGKTVGIAATTQGELPSGVELTGVTINPSVVTLYAAPDVLAGLEQITLAPIDLSGLTANATVSLPLALPEGVLKASATDVQVTVQVKP